ncbi:MAG TPA: hypothetical protein VL285_14740 [Bryobacteraceae bacterium]|jgi:hypothetical protein|nr:hypothetical protein [Bryobacteraceae bacterium]
MRRWIATSAITAALLMAGCARKEEGESNAHQAGRVAHDIAEKTEEAAKKAQRKVKQAAREAREGWKEAEREDNRRK